VDSQVVDDEDAVVQSGAPAAVENLGPLAAATDLQALDLEDSGDALFVLDITAVLGAAGAVGPRDVVRYDGLAYSLELDGGANGLPAGSRIDALSGASGGGLLMSLDVTVSFAPPNALVPFVADDEDVIRWDAADGFSLEFDGSAAGVPTSLDTDAVHLIEASQNLLLSFDTAGSLGGVNFDDDDVLEYDADGGTWELSLLGDAAWGGADRDAFHAVRSCAALGGDADSDKLCQDEDPCLIFPNTLPAAIPFVLGTPNGDLNADGIPNECQCGDPNGSGGYEADDLFQVFECQTTDPEALQPLCAGRIIKGDANNSGRWEADDLFRIFGAQTGTTFQGFELTCSVRPEGTPPPPLP
jgi:hypothetical protein